VPSYSDEDPLQPQPRPARIHIGRGGCIWLDHRITAHRALPRQGRSRRSALLSLTDEDEEQAEDEEAIQQLAERWKFDLDDRPAFGPQGADEQDRILIDDYESQ
jgi:enhancer of polycomb-like protein